MNCELLHTGLIPKQNILNLMQITWSLETLFWGQICCAAASSGVSPGSVQLFHHRSHVSVSEVNVTQTLLLVRLVLFVLMFYARGTWAPPPEQLLSSVCRPGSGCPGRKDLLRAPVCGCQRCEADAAATGTSAQTWTDVSLVVDQTWDELLQDHVEVWLFMVVEFCQ